MNKQHVVSFRPMKEEDYVDQLSGEVKYQGKADPRAFMDSSLNSFAIFGSEPDYYNGVATSEMDNQRGYIHLCRPVLNVFVAGTGGATLAKILGCSQTLFAEINAFTKVYSISKNAYVLQSEVKDVNDMVCYGDIYRNMINNFDIECETKKEIVSYLSKYFRPRHIEVDIADIKRGRGKYALIGDYYYDPKQRIEDVHENTLLNYLADHALQKGTERLIYLLNLTDEKLKGCLMDYVSVIPRGMRPVIGGRNDPITTAYSNIIGANAKLFSVLKGGFSAAEVVQFYKNLAISVSQLVYKSESKKKKKNAQASAIKEKLQSKGGLIRKGMLAKRCDYTGRSVIVINPELGIDECALPVEMICKLYRHHYFKRVSTQEAEAFLKLSPEAQTKKIVDLGILDEIPCILNRQPTLHSLSIQSYYAKVSKSKAIEVNGYVCDGFNADFDGDQMGVHVPITDEAVRDAQTIMLPSHNLFKPSSGAPILVPRMEMLYGLYIATLDYPVGKSKGTYAADQLMEALFNQDLAVEDTVTLDDDVKKIKGPAGKLLVYSVMPYTSLDEVKTVNKKTIGSYVERILKENREVIKQALQDLEIIGFRLAQIYSPTVTIAEKIDRKFIKDTFAQFHKDMELETELYEAGFESEEIYNQIYADTFRVADNKILKELETSLPKTNGFRLLAESGARDSWPNILQIYSHKGMISRPDGKAFNTVIENCFAEQLTPREHFISAYGSRKGSIDKSIKPGDTGYTQRQMWHVTQDIVITCDDCGTTEGYEINRQDYRDAVEDFSKTAEQVEKEVDDKIKKIITGRYEAGTNRYIDEKTAEAMCHNESITIRSPLTCKDPCCSKCYGDDLAIRGKAVVGTAVGIIAGQSIGEPGTQLVMKTFHKGGVAGRGDVSSVFDSFSRLIQLQSITRNDSYTPLAWATGKTEIVSTNRFTGQKTVKIEGFSRHVTVASGVRVKPEVVRGESMLVDVGSYEASELLEYKGLKALQDYLVRCCFLLYFGEGKVNIKHFEVLISGMAIHTVVKSDNPELKPGQSYTTSELVERGGVTANTILAERIKSVKMLEQFRASAMGNFIMENIVNGFSRACLLGSYDLLKGPFQSLALGVKPRIGSYYPDFRREREAAERTSH